MSHLRNISFLILLSAISTVCVTQLYSFHSSRKNLSLSYLTKLPEKIAIAFSVEFQGIVADYLLLNTLTFMGDKVLNLETTNESEWKQIHQALQIVIALDPKANDPYVLAETTLPWEAGMVEETNDLLKKVAKAQPQNPQPFFFLWFNHYYFKNDLEKAASYLEKAASFPKAPKYYATLAARMHLMSGEHKEGIIFLQSILDETKDPKRREFIKKRLLSLKILYFLDSNIQRYRSLFGKPPDTLQDLVDKKIIKNIPKDPYGGTFFINEKGRAYTTSKLVGKKNGKANKVTN